MSLHKVSIQFQRTIIFVLKAFLYVGIFYIFFLLFYIDSPQIIRPSRTSGVTMTTFAAVLLSLTTAYGGYCVGKKKSKDIILSVFIATLLTDFITYFEFVIMNFNQYNKQYLDFTNIGILFIVILLQLIYIYLLTYLGNYVFFRINPPEKCVVIVPDTEKVAEYVQKIGKFKKQFEIVYIITSEDTYTCKKHIRVSDTVFLFDMLEGLKAELIDYSYRHHKNIYYNLELADVVINQSKHTVIDDISLLHTSFKGLTFEQRIIKRLVDVLVSGIALLILSPIFLIEAIAIKISDRGPVFYKQERLTREGKPFQVLKFRTMVVDAEKGKAMLSSKNDSRITPIGKFLRATRLDEIPQLINVFLGQMSIVGPRPERRSIAAEYTKDLPEFKFRLRAKAGLTGLAQIRGKYNTSPKDKLILDLMYIEGYSIWKDFLIMLQTLLIFFKTDSTEGFDEDQHIEFEIKSINTHKINEKNEDINYDL